MHANPAGKLWCARRKRSSPNGPLQTESSISSIRKSETLTEGKTKTHIERETHKDTLIYLTELERGRDGKKREVFSLVQSTLSAKPPWPSTQPDSILAKVYFT